MAPSTRRRIPIAALALAALLPGACSTNPPAGRAESPPVAAAYRCDTRQPVEVLYEGQDTLRLFAPGRPVQRLARVRAASGARYAAGGFEFWEKGETALLTVPDQERIECRRLDVPATWAEAAAAGATFRALGQEPGWTVRVGPERITAELDYGETELQLPAPAPQHSGNATVWRTRSQAHTLRLSARTAPCRDAMSGFRLPARATLTVDGETYRGCGRWLAAAGD